MFIRHEKLTPPPYLHPEDRMQAYKTRRNLKLPRIILQEGFLYHHEISAEFHRVPSGITR